MPRGLLVQLPCGLLCASGTVITDLSTLRDADPSSWWKCFTTIWPNVCATAVLLACLSHFPVIFQPCDSSICFQNIRLFLKPVKEGSHCLKVNTPHTNTGQLCKQLLKPRNFWQARLPAKADGMEREMPAGVQSWQTPRICLGFACFRCCFLLGLIQFDPC